MRSTRELPPVPWMGPSPSWDVPSGEARRARIDSLHVTRPSTDPAGPVPQSTKTSITVRRAPVGTGGTSDPTRVEVHGALDVASVVGFRAMLSELAGEPAIHLDLSGCGFIDAAGIGALVGAARRLHDAGTEMVITGLRPSVRAALHAASVDRVVDASNERHPAHAA